MYAHDWMYMYMQHSYQLCRVLRQRKQRRRALCPLDGNYVRTPQNEVCDMSLSQLYCVHEIDVLHYIYTYMYIHVPHCL